MKARSIAREMALLGLSQLTDGLGRQGSAKQGMKRHGVKRHGNSAEANAEPMTTKDLDSLLIKALASLGSDARETLDTAEGTLKRGERLILESETRTVEKDEMRDRIQPAVPLVQTAINQAGETLDLLLFAQQGDTQAISAVRNALIAAADRLNKGDALLIAQAQRTADIQEAGTEIKVAVDLVRGAIAQLNQSLETLNLANSIQRNDIRSYARDLLHHWIMHHAEVDTLLDSAMENWNMRRLPRVDRDILRLAMLEITRIDVPIKVAIDEAIEMAKRYSDEDGYRFINGVLRRATDKLKEAS